jgi:hypothetical protein
VCIAETLTERAMYVMEGHVGIAKQSAHILVD